MTKYILAVSALPKRNCKTFYLGHFMSIVVITILISKHNIYSYIIYQTVIT